MISISADRKLIVLHTPKCGGSSLLRSLQNEFGKSAIHKDYAYVAGERVISPPTIKQPIIYGHFPARKYENQRNAFWVTLLRHPVDRMLSLYFNWRFSTGQNLKNPISSLRYAVRQERVGLLEFARMPNMARRLSGYYYAKFDMRRFDLIIPHHNYAVGVCELGKRLGVNLELEFRNISSSRSPEYDIARHSVLTDMSTIHALEGILREEIELYEFCTTLPSFVHEVKFRERKEQSMQLAGLTANGERSMTGKLTTSTIAVRLAATRIAAEAGLRWKELSREERMERMKAARIHVNKKDRQGAAQRIAKKAVEASGLNWKDLSTEERQEKVKAARRLTPKAAV